MLSYFSIIITKSIPILFYIGNKFGYSKDFSYFCTQVMKEPQPLVSFILTYYDLPVQMLCECIDSILALSLATDEREIIIIDDGSDVSPMNSLMQYGDEIVYVRQKNGGLSVARNKGIEVATGQYLQFVDADDYILQAPYDYCLSLLRQHKDTDMLMFDFTNRPQPATVSDETMVLSGTELMHHYNIHGTAWGYLFRRKTLSELRFTPGIVHEDEEFTPQLLIRAERVIVTKAQAYFYRQRNNSITTNATDEKRRKRLDDCHGVILRLHQMSDRLPQNDRLALQRRVAQLTMDYLYQVIRQTRSRQELEERIATLRAEGLFPLPNRDYSQKYKWFRRLSQTAWGRTILLNTLPLLRPER